MYIWEKKLMIDLHTHSNASDGEFSPSELAKKAVEEGLSAWALTDHDTIAGNTEAAETSKELGIDFVAGTELNIYWSAGEFHLLGLGFKKESDELHTVLESLQQGRIDRNRQIVEKMRADGIDVTYEQLQEHFNSSTIGRPHIARFLVEKKIVYRTQDAFDRFLAKGRAWYVPRYGAPFKEAADAIISSGGLPVLAHPLSLYISWGKLWDLISELKEQGLKGIEVWHPGTKVNESLRLKEFAEKFGLLITAGSDFHGPSVRKDRTLGHTTANKKIDFLDWEQLKVNFQ